MKDRDEAEGEKVCMCVCGIDKGGGAVCSRGREFICGDLSFEAQHLTKDCKPAVVSKANI